MISRKQAYKYCKDYTKIENYEQAIKDDETWICHHRLETHFSDGTERPVNARLSLIELIVLGMYYDRPPEEFIFLRRKDHQRLHYKDYKLSKEHKRKISESQKGVKSHMYGKHHTDESKRKISDAHKGKHWYNNGTVQTLAFECPEGFKPGFLPRK